MPSFLFSQAPQERNTPFYGLQRASLLLSWPGPLQQLTPFEPQRLKTAIGNGIWRLVRPVISQLNHANQMCANLHIAAVATEVASDHPVPQPRAPSQIPSTDCKPPRARTLNRSPASPSRQPPSAACHDEPVREDVRRDTVTRKITRAQGHRPCQ